MNEFAIHVSFRPLHSELWLSQPTVNKCWGQSLQCGSQVKAVFIACHVVTPFFPFIPTPPTLLSNLRVCTPAGRVAPGWRSRSSDLSLIILGSFGAGLVTLSLQLLNGFYTHSLTPTIHFWGKHGKPIQGRVIFLRHFVISTGFCGGTFIWCFCHRLCAPWAVTARPKIDPSHQEKISVCCKCIVQTVRHSDQVNIFNGFWLGQVTLFTDIICVRQVPSLSRDSAAKAWPNQEKNMSVLQ